MFPQTDAFDFAEDDKKLGKLLSSNLDSLLSSQSSNQ